MLIRLLLEMMEVVLGLIAECPNRGSWDRQSGSRVRCAPMGR